MKIDDGLGSQKNAARPLIPKKCVAPPPPKYVPDARVHRLCYTPITRTYATWNYYLAPAYPASADIEMFTIRDRATFGFVQNFITR
jgi:hypothetical protein